MRRRTTLFLTLLVVVLVGGVLAIGLSASRAADRACKVAGHKRYQTVIKDDKPSLVVVRGNLCDTLTIVNNDQESRLIAFGQHDDHVPYDGVGERLLAHGQSLTITFDQVGQFEWHDHLHDEVIGHFIVSK